MTKQRIDILMVERGLAESRSLAQRLVMAGEVRVNGQVELKASAKVDESSEIIVAQGPQFVSRGGEKLLGALEAFNLLDLSGLICADIGSSTGGFTDCMLQHGAAYVFAVDVGYGILHWKLRQDERVEVMERTNARYIQKFPRPVDLVTVDASFISLRIILPAAKLWFGPQGGRVLALIKPQFEAGRKDAAKGEGVIRDPAVHEKVLREITRFVIDEGFAIQGLARSPLIGPKGNVEFLANLVYPGQGEDFPLDETIQRLVYPQQAEENAVLE